MTVHKPSSHLDHASHAPTKASYTTCSLTVFQNRAVNCEDFVRIDKHGGLGCENCASVAAVEEYKQPSTGVIHEAHNRRSRSGGGLVANRIICTCKLCGSEKLKSADGSLRIQSPVAAGPFRTRCCREHRGNLVCGLHDRRGPAWGGLHPVAQ